jgi:addiction module HigA family antidote
MITPVTLGEILLEDYLKPMRVSRNVLARAIQRTVNEIAMARRTIRPQMSLRLGKFFRQSPQFWFNLQSTYDFRVLQTEADKITSKVKQNYRELAAAQ